MKISAITLCLGLLAACLAGCAADDGQPTGASHASASLGAGSAVLPAPTVEQPTASDDLASMPAQGELALAAPYASTSAYDGGNDTDDDSDGIEDPLANLEEQQRLQELNDAKRGVIDAQDDLNRAVRRLGDNDWDNDLPNVQRRLRDLEDANDRLSSVDPQAASDMDFEISRMKRETRRLEDENWRDVVPDLEHRNRALDDEADDLENSINQ